MQTAHNVKSLGTLYLQSQREKLIDEYKVFYKKYLTRIVNRNVVLTALKLLCEKFSKKPATLLFMDSDTSSLVTEAEHILTKYFGNDFVLLYKKDIPITFQKTERPSSQDFLRSLFDGVSEILEFSQERTRQQFNYKRNFLNFVYDCLLNYGLHSNIFKREPEEYKRFNLVVIHRYISRKPLRVMKCFLTYDEYCKQFRNLYLPKGRIKFGGLLIPFEKIDEVKITTTVLKDDEIQLFGLEHNFNWNDKYRDIESFINYCTDETEKYHPNPFDTTSCKELDELLIEQTRNFLQPYPSAHKLYIKAVTNFEASIFERNVLDDLRLSLELLLKEILRNNVPLEKQLPHIGKYQKQKGASPEITNMLRTVIDHYAQYQNNYVKHNDKVKSNEIEFMINLTSTLMRFLIR